MKCAVCPCEWWWCRENKDCLLHKHDERGQVRTATLMTAPKKPKKKTKLGNNPNFQQRFWRRVEKKKIKKECVYCGSKEDLTIDHKKPLSKGGTNKASNLQICCFICNQKKGDQYPYNPI